MSFTSIDIKDIPNTTDTIRIKGDVITLDLLVFCGKDGDYFVAISPSANVSGYGTTEEEAYASFDHNATEFGLEILALSSSERDRALRELGFKAQKFHNKNFSKAFVDQNGVLQNFEPGTIKTNKLQAELAA